MIAVSEALLKLTALVEPLPSEVVALQQAGGRVLASDVKAPRNQPPFASSAMDGYAVPAAGLRRGARYLVIGEAAAGHAFTKPVGMEQAVRIFTGAPLPTGANYVVIQENVNRDGQHIVVTGEVDTNPYIRDAGSDFKAGQRLIAPRQLQAADIALLAAMNQPVVRVRRKPVVAVIATGDELVMPGEIPRPDQIIASNGFGLKTLFEANGADVRLLPIARDTVASLSLLFEFAEETDLIVTIGGASVGDHDLVASASTSIGLERSFYKVAMRPGKPLMAGCIKGTPIVGLPGNPVSSMVCGHVFILPMIDRLLGLPKRGGTFKTAPLSCAIPANAARQHYMRARLEDGVLTPFDRQDSALLTVLVDANALLIRPPHGPALHSGTHVPYICL